MRGESGWIRGDPGFEFVIAQSIAPSSSHEGAGSAGFVVDAADEAADSREVGSGGIHTHTEAGPKPGRNCSEEMSHSRLPSECRTRVSEPGWVVWKPKLRASSGVKDMRREFRSKEITDMVDYLFRCFERLGFRARWVEVDEEVSNVSNVFCTWTTVSNASKMDPKVKVPGMAFAKAR